MRFEKYDTSSEIFHLCENSRSRTNSKSLSSAHRRSKSPGKRSTSTNKKVNRRSTGNFSDEDEDGPDPLASYTSFKNFRETKNQPGQSNLAAFTNNSRWKSKDIWPVIYQCSSMQKPGCQFCCHFLLKQEGVRLIFCQGWISVGVSLELFQTVIWILL